MSPSEQQILECYVELVKELETTVTEEQYSVISDLATIRAASSALRNIAPGCHGDAFKEDWQMIMQTLYKLDTELTNTVHCRES